MSNKDKYDARHRRPKGSHQDAAPRQRRHVWLLVLAFATLSFFVGRWSVSSGIDHSIDNQVAKLQMISQQLTATDPQIASSSAPPRPEATSVSQNSPRVSNDAPNVNFETNSRYTECLELVDSYNAAASALPDTAEVRRILQRAKLPQQIDMSTCDSGGAKDPKAKSDRE